MNAKGFSLIEVLISLVIISIAAMLVANFGTTYNTRGNTTVRACQGHAEAIISRISQETYFRTVANHMPIDVPGQIPGALVPDPGTGTNQFTYSVEASPAIPSNSGWHWFGTNADQIVDWRDDLAPQLHNNLLIQGSLATLVAIYNNRPAVQCQFGTYDPLTSTATILPPEELTRIDPTLAVAIKLQPYNVTNRDLFCSVPMAAAPQPGNINIPDPNAIASVADSGVYTVGSVPPPMRHNADTDVRSSPIASASRLAGRTFPVGGGHPEYYNGIELTVRVTYQVNGQNQQCFATQRFEYPRDLFPPPVPNRAHIQLNESVTFGGGGGPKLRDWCGGPPIPANGGARVVLRVGYENVAGANRPESGTQLLCKDLSWERSVRTVAAGGFSESRLCRQGTAPGDSAPTVHFTEQPFNLNQLLPNLIRPRLFNIDGDGAPGGFDPTPYDDTFTFANRQDEWTPCLTLRQCNVPPDSVVRAFDEAATDMYYDLTYSNLPPGCKMNFEVVAVDSAGNRSGRRDANGVNKQFLTNNRTWNTTTVYANPVGPDNDFNYTAYDDEVYYPTCGNANDPLWRSGLGHWCEWQPPPLTFPGVPVWTPYYRCDIQNCYAPL